MSDARGYRIDVVAKTCVDVSNIVGSWLSNPESGKDVGPFRIVVEAVFSVELDVTINAVVKLGTVLGGDRLSTEGPEVAEIAGEKNV